MIPRLAYHDHRGETFFVEYFHGVIDIDDDGRLVIRPIIFAACHYSGALFYCRLDQCIYPGTFRGRDQRTYHCRRVFRVTHLERGGLFGELPAELIVDRRFHDDTGSGHADLALMQKDTEGSGVNGKIHICIGKHDKGTLAAHLQSNFLAVGGRLHGQLPAGGGGTGKGHHLDTWIGSHDIAEHGRLAGHNVQDPRRQAGRFEQLADHQADDRCVVRRFQDKGIAGGERQTNLFGRQDEREIKRRYTRYHAQRFANGHGEHTRTVRGDGFAKDTARFSGGAAQHIHDETGLEGGFQQRPAGIGDDGINIILQS